MRNREGMRSPASQSINGPSQLDVGAAAIAIAAAGLVLLESGIWVGDHIAGEGIKITDAAAVGLLIVSSALWAVLAAAHYRAGVFASRVFVLLAVALLSKSVMDGGFGYTLISAESFALVAILLSSVATVLGVAGAALSWRDHSIRWWRIAAAVVTIALGLLTALLFAFPGRIEVG